MGGRLDAPPPRIRGDSDLSQTFPPREVSYRKLFSFVLPVGISATRKRVSYRRQSRFRRGANASSSQTPPAGQPGGGKGSSTLCQHESQTDKAQKARMAANTEISVYLAPRVLKITIDEDGCGRGGTAFAELDKKSTAGKKTSKNSGLCKSRQLMVKAGRPFAAPSDHAASPPSQIGAHSAPGRKGKPRSLA